jgi:hypothetical protein
LQAPAYERRTLILTVNYEEMQALRAGAQNLLSEDAEGPCAVLAPPEDKAAVIDLLSRLEGDISVQNLEELRSTERAIGTILECLRVEMEMSVVAAHPADEFAVSAYFEFAHVLSVARRLEEMADEMAALIEVVTGGPVTAESVRGFQFPD